MDSNGSNARNNWQKLAREAAGETDPVKLSRLVQELCDALDEVKKTGFRNSEDDSGEVA